MRAPNAREGGLALVEMLVSVAITMTIVGALFQLMNPAKGAFNAQPETADLQQRLRVAVDSLGKDLIMAGAGTYSGAAGGPLTRYFAPVIPYRIADRNSDPRSGTFYREDAITLIYVPPTPSQTTISAGMLKTSTELRVEAQANCPRSTPNQVCGFKEGMRAALFDSFGFWDSVTIKGIQDDALNLQYSGELSANYAPGSTITQVSMHAYYLKTDIQKKTYQLMHYDGAETDLPVVDNVVTLRFQYFGEPEPPRLLPASSLSDAAGPWTTYGPRPPDLGEKGAPGWPIGENCIFTVADGSHASRLMVLAAGAGQVALDPAILTDGPWCPDENTSERYDADLLRVRRIRVTLRVQAAAESLRGSGELFRRSGTSIGGQRYVPDQEIRFDVAPRNLNLGR